MDGRSMKASSCWCGPTNMWSGRRTKRRPVPRLYCVRWSARA